MQAPDSTFMLRKKSFDILPHPRMSGPATHPQLRSLKCRKYVFNLLMAPFGSDQSRHVDDFGAKNHNFDDFDAKKRVIWTTFRRNNELRASIYRWPHLFIDGPASMNR